MNSAYPPFPEELVPREDLSFDLDKHRHLSLQRFHVDFNPCGEPIPFATDRAWSEKPLVALEKQAMFAEVAMLTLFRKSGWDGVWADIAHKKFFDKMPNQSKGVSLTTYISQALARIVEGNGQSRSGCWDLILWKNKAIVFVAAMPAPLTGGVGDSRARWLDAALHSGMSAGQFVVVEWEYRKVIVRRKHPAS
jgi:hypothetical protein